MSGAPPLRPERIVEMEATANRYATDWNSYSAEWDQRYGRRYRHLGDEWCDDGTENREWERRLFAHAVEPYLRSSSRAIEIGPGGGKWTVRLAPKVAELVVFDVAQAMLERTLTRVSEAGLENVSYRLGNGRDMEPLESGGFDVVFSYDVFVHIALEDTVAYVAEIARLLRPGGIAILHHAVNDIRAAWDRIETHNEWYRDRDHTRGQYYYHSQSALERLYARFGLRVEATWTHYSTVVLTIRKPADSIVADLEQALYRAGLAADREALGKAMSAIEKLGYELVARAERLTRALRDSDPGPARFETVQRLRSLFRG
jgi:ubiquinone/menaquinone biosynthesis C-methylase UbiE